MPETHSFIQANIADPESYRYGSTPTFDDKKDFIRVVYDTENPDSKTIQLLINKGDIDLDGQDDFTTYDVNHLFWAGPSAYLGTLDNVSLKAPGVYVDLDNDGLPDLTRGNRANTHYSLDINIDNNGLASATMSLNANDVIDHSDTKEDAFRKGARHLNTNAGTDISPSDLQNAEYSREKSNAAGYYSEYTYETPADINQDQVMDVAEFYYSEHENGVTHTSATWEVKVSPSQACTINDDGIISWLDLN